MLPDDILSTLTMNFAQSEPCVVLLTVVIVVLDHVDDVSIDKEVMVLRMY